MSDDIMRIPRQLADEARALQKQLRDRGINRPLWECLEMVTKRKKAVNPWGNFRL